MAINGKTVFLVDDDPDDRYLARTAIQDSGIPVNIMEFSLALEVWDYIKLENTKLPDLMILDLNMPNVNGFELLKMLRSEKKTKILPCVVYSTSTDNNDLTKSYELGANSFVVKPLSYASTKTVYERLCKYWLEVSKTPSCSVLTRRN